MSNILISVLMSVFNENTKFLKLSIDSIINQTYKNIEFIIVNDSPLNETVNSILDGYESKYNNIKLIKNTDNIGLAKSLNKAIELSQGAYIARMDSDDISKPDRIEKQLNYLIYNNYDLIGSYIEKIDAASKPFGISKVPSNSKKIIHLLPYATVAFHPTWLGKENIFKELKYNSIFSTTQDYDFLNRMIAKGYKVSNIEEVLLQYRFTYNSISEKKSFFQINFHYLINLKRKNSDLDLNLSIEQFLMNIDKKEEQAYIKANNVFIEFSKRKSFFNALIIFIYLFKSRMFRYKIKNFLCSKIIKEF